MEMLLAFSNFLQNYGWLLLAAVAVALVVVRMKLQGEAGKVMADRAKLKIPVLGGILMNLAVARFCRVLGTLLGNGVPILKSLEISGTAAGNRLLRDSVTDATENIRSGESLASPLRASGHFPPSVVEMISVGEESNSLDTVLPDIADSLEKTTFRRLDLFVRLLEPIMLLVMAILVLGVVLAPWATAEETPAKQHHPEAVKAKEVAFASPALTGEPATTKEMMKDLGKVLAKHEGILAARFDDKDKVVRVTFDPTKINDKLIHKAVDNTLPSCEVRAVKDVEWAPKDCGKCPSKHKCAGKNEGEDKGAGDTKAPDKG